MPAQHNLNIPPYNDDWDPKKKFNRVMYRPGFPIQARELNQSQTILQDQIEQIASHFLVDGDVITPGEFYMTNPAPYVRVSTITNGSEPSEFIGYNLTGVQSGVRARVVHATEATEDDDVTFYVVYETSGSTSEFDTFLEQETLESDTPENYTAKVGVTSISKPISSAAIGNGTLFSVTEGAYYVNGFVVRNEEQIITLDKYGTGPNYQVGFIISEEFVTSAEDTSLLDNSQGSSNFAAPGADRLKISLTLGKLLLDSKVPDFIMLAKVQNGSLVGKTDKSIKWDWLYDILAKRTFDESGDYIVSDFAIKPLEYYNSDQVDGVWDPDPDTGEYPPIPASGIGDPLTFDAAEAFYALRVDPGLAYVQGYECGVSSPMYVYGNKPRALKFLEDNFTKITEGYNITVTNCYGTPSLTNISEGETINAFDTLVLYRNFIDGYVGESVETLPNGKKTGRPMNWGSTPVTTVHIIADGPIGDTGLDPSQVIYNQGNSCVISVTNPEAYTRDYTIGGATILVANIVRPRPSGVIKPKFFTPKQLTFDGIGTGEAPFNGYNSTFKMGILSSVYFTEIAVVEDSMAEGQDLDWSVGYEISGMASQAVGVVEEGSTSDMLIISNAIGEFKNGELVVQQQGAVRKISRILREGEAVAMQFYTGGDIANVTEIEVRSLGLVTQLRSSYEATDDLGATVTVSDFEFDSTKVELKLTERGRNKLYNFPYTGGSSLNERVNYALTTNTGAKGYVITVPAKITHTLDKTKSIYSDLSVLSSDKFSSDISMKNSADSDVFTVAGGALFSGVVGQNFITCENFSGDASQELVANDIVTFVDDQGRSINKLVLFATKPVGYGEDRTKSIVYFTTALDVAVTSKAVQRMRIRTYGEETQNLIYKLPVDTVASLQTDPKTTRIDYKVNRQFIQQVSAGATSFTLASMRDNERFISDPSKVSVSLQRGTSGSSPDSVGRFLNVIDVSFGDDDSRQATFTLNGPLPDNCVLKVNCQLRVINAQAKQKILKNTVLEIGNFIQSQPDIITTNKLPSNRVISLGRPDVFRVNSITMTAPAGAEGAVDISDNYTFDNGQRDNYYDLSRLLLKTGRPAALDSIYVDIDYFEHSDEGDFFSVDSYTHDEGVSYGEIPFYIQGSSGLSTGGNKGRVIQLRDCVDFRPVVNSVDSVIASITDGATSVNAQNFKDSNFDGDAFVPRIPVANTEFECDISYYLPRYDSLFMDKTGTLILLEGNPSTDPTPPADLTTALRLYDLYLPAYLFSVKDVEVKKYNYRRYTMADIAAIDRKVDNITEIVSLSLLEHSALNMGVRDAVTGLDRFKNGIVVDTFKDHGKGDVDALDYQCSIDPAYTHLRPANFTDQIELEEKNQTDNQRDADKYTINDGVITCPYDNVDFLANPYATGAIKLHPFAAYSYHGNLKLYPEVDTNKDIYTRPDLIIETNSLYDALKSMPENKAASGFGTVWGEWETNGMSLTSKNSPNSSRDDNSLLKITGINQSSQALKAQTNITINQQTSSIKHTSFGDRVVDIQLGQTMRSIPVTFQVTKLRANTRYYAFFDDVDVTAWISADEIVSSYPDGVSRYAFPSNINRVPFGEPLLSDDEGTISGVFIVPNGRSPLKGSVFTSMNELEYEKSGSTRSFNVGQRVFRLTTSKTNSLDRNSVGAYADAVFTSGVVIDDKKESVVSTRIADTSFRVDENDRSKRTMTSTGVADVEVSVRGPERLSRTIEVSRENVIDRTAVNETTIVNQVNVLTNGANDAEVRYDITTQRDIVAQSPPENVKLIEVEQKPQAEMQDPIAQSFLVDKTNPEGVFVTELDVYFESKDKHQPVMAYIVTCDGGVPSKTIVPHSKVVKKANTTLRVKVQIPAGAPSAVLKAGYVINGTKSGASGVVKAEALFETPAANAETNVTNTIYNLVIDNYEGDFIADEVITSPNLIGSAGETIFTIVPDEYELTRVDLFDMGAGYDETTTIQFSEPNLPGGRTASAVVKVAQMLDEISDGTSAVIPGVDGQVYEIILTDPGSGYTQVPEVYVVGPGSKAQAVAKTKPGRKAVTMGVAVSADGSIPTTFKFEAPVYLLGNTEYAFVLESPNSIDYKVYTSKLGETIAERNERVTKQPSLGTLFKSQNGGVWSEDQTQDITFLLRRASFVVNTASSLKLVNAPLTKIRLQRDPIETNVTDSDPTSYIYGVNPRVVKVLHYNHGHAPGDMVALDGITGDGFGPTLSGIPIEELNTLHKILDSDLNSFTIIVTTPADKAAVAGGATATSSYNRPYEVSNVCTGLMTFGSSLVGTTLRGAMASGLSVIDIRGGKEVRYNQDYSYVIPQIEPIKLMESFYHNQPMQVASLINECQFNDGVHLGNQKSVETDIRMSTISTRVSPVVDLQRTNMTLARNLINKPRELSNVLGAASNIFTFLNPVDLSVGSPVTINGVDTKVTGVDATKRSISVASGPHQTFSNAQFADPVLDDQLKSVITRASENFDPETRVIGSSNAKWISKLFVFENPCDGIEVRLTSIFYEVDSLRAYFRPRTIGFDSDLTLSSWIPFNPNQSLPGELRRVSPDGLILSPGDVGYNSDLQLVKSPALADNIDMIQPRSSSNYNPKDFLPNEWQSVTWSAQDLAKFDAVSIKIVMVSENPAQAPIIDDFQLVVSE